MTDAAAGDAPGAAAAIAGAVATAAPEAAAEVATALVETNPDNGGSQDPGVPEYRTIGGAFNDYGEDIEILPTGIEKELLLDMIAYPNPAFDKVLFKGGDPSGIYHIRVVDKLGRILLQKTLPASDLEILVEGYNNGTYLIEVIEDKTNKRRVFNVIKSSNN